MRSTALHCARALVTLVCLAALSPADPAMAAGIAPVEEYPIPPDGVFRMQGSGWGHGRGMSQWGAHQAATEGRTYAEILAFYYPGATLAPLESAWIRVLLSADRGRDLVVRAVPGMTVTVGEAAARALPRTPNPCRARATRWRARAVSHGVRLDAYCRRWRKVSPGAGASTIAFEVPGGVVGTQNRSVRRGYRGQVAALRTGSRSVQVVNTVPMEQYLRPVVAAEVPPSWPVESLRAQAVAARSYAAHEALSRSARTFDVHDTTRSQAYPGAVGLTASWQVIRSREDPRTDQAIADTAGLQMTVAGAPAFTQFGSSNGGATAATALPYMVVRADPWDAAAISNPRLSWTDSVSAASLGARYPRAGAILAVRVVSREGAGPWGGRISRLDLVGTDRTYTLTSDAAIRSTLGASSSVLTFVP